MITPAHDQLGRVEEETPRRDAIRTIGLAGAALLGIAGRDATADGNGKLRALGAEKKKTKKRKRKKSCSCQKIGLTFAESARFTVGANQGVTQQADCPAGFIALSGGLEGTSPVTTPCMIRESHVTPSGNAWVINVYCTEASSIPLFVGALCLSEASFQIQ